MVFRHPLASLISFVSPLLAATLPPATATEYHVSPVGSDAAGGGPGDPFATVAHAVAQASEPGDVVTVRGGVYRGERVRFAASGTADAPVVLRAAAGERVVLKGSAVIDPASWTRSAERFPDEPVYSAPWSDSFGRFAERFLDDDPENDTRHRGDKPRDRFYLGSGSGYETVLEEVGRADWLTGGTCLLDAEADLLYLWAPGGADPATLRVEGTTQAAPLIDTAGHDHLVVRGLHLDQLANGPQGGAALRVPGTLRPGHPSNSAHVLVEDCVVTRAAGSALSVSGEDCTVRRCRLNDNGQNGLHVAGARRCLFEEIEYARNNRHPGRTFDFGWEAVMKCSSSVNCTFDRIHSHENWGIGWWVDGPRNLTNVLQNSRIEGNRYAGIRIEIAFDTTVRNNLITGNGAANGQPAIGISASAGVRIERNTIVDNRSLALDLEPRVGRWDREGWELSSYAVVVRRNVIANNQRGKYQKSWAFRQPAADTSDNLPQEGGYPRALAYRENVSDENLFWMAPDHPSREPIFVGDGLRTRDFDEYRAATGQDAGSVWADPFVGDGYEVKPALARYGADLSRIVPPGPGAEPAAAD